MRFLLDFNKNAWNYQENWGRVWHCVEWLVYDRWRSWVTEKTNEEERRRKERVTSVNFTKYKSITNMHKKYYSKHYQSPSPKTMFMN